MKITYKCTIRCLAFQTCMSFDLIMALRGNIGELVSTSGEVIRLIQLIFRLKLHLESSALGTYQHIIISLIDDIYFSILVLLIESIVILLDWTFSWSPKLNKNSFTKRFLYFPISKINGINLLSHSVPFNIIHSRNSKT